MKDGWIGKVYFHSYLEDDAKKAKAGSFGSIIGDDTTANQIRQKAYGGGSGHWAAIPIPGGIVDSGVVSFAIPSHSAHQNVAVDVIEWLTSLEMQKWAYESPMAAFPANVEMLSGENWVEAKYPYFGGQNVLKMLADSVIDAKPNPSLWAAKYSNAPTTFLNAIESFSNNAKQDPVKLWNNALKEAEKSN